jgi:asparagine synthase (glutamine-hydrolysing)
VLLRLSGGLDSSIVLGCLRDAPSRPRITCLNEHSEGPDSDERHYAREASRAACCELIEQRRDPATPLDGMLCAARSTIPLAYVGCYERSRSERALARQCGATAILTGSGGDQVFFQNPAPLTVADFIHRRGWRADLLRVAYDAAQMEGWSVWRMLKEAWTQGVRLREYNPLLESLPYRTLVSDEVLELVRNGSSSVVPRESTRDVPPGKLWHAYMLSILPEYYDPFGREGDPEAIAPLHSQPLIETALRIPTYVLLSDGWDRALARRAFAAELPPMIARRRSKGGIAEHKYDVLRNNLRFVRELLLDGLLMREGLLNRANVEEALSDRPSGVMKGMAEICGILDTEVWLRLWEPHLRMSASSGG